eukprot:3199220-Rhodomonas_salina.2
MGVCDRRRASAGPRLTQPVFPGEETAIEAPGDVCDGQAATFGDPYSLSCVRDAWSERASAGQTSRASAGQRVSAGQTSRVCGCQRVCWSNVTRGMCGVVNCAVSWERLTHMRCGCCCSSRTQTRRLRPRSTRSPKPRPESGYSPHEMRPCLRVSGATTERFVCNNAVPLPGLTQGLVLPGSL